MDAREFAEIAEKHSNFVYNVAFKIMGNQHDAEEVAQDAFVSAFKAKDNFRGDAMPTTWLYRIATNAALMRIRKDKRGKAFAVSEDTRPDVASSTWDESPNDVTMNKELDNRIDNAMVTLPEDLRVAVVLRDVQGLSNKEAAESVGVSLAALKARLHRGRISLRISLASCLHEEDSIG